MVEPGFAPGDVWLDPFVAKQSLDDLFAMLATEVRFEPYPGTLRGAIGTAMSRRGNSLDQALLLKMVLDMQGYRTRLAEGELEKTNALVLLRGMYPPKLPSYAYGEEYAPFRLEAQPSLMEIVRRHYWVELKQGEGNWLPLDPSFPRAKIGESYAKATHHYDHPPDEWSQRISIRLLQKTADNHTRILLKMEKPVSAWGYVPVSLSCVGIPLMEKQKSPARKGSAAGLFGSALGGGAPAKKMEKPQAKPKKLGTRYRWTWRMHGEGERSTSHDVLSGKSGTGIVREWLEIILKTPGRAERKLERVLYEASGKSDKPPAYRRHLLMVLPGAVHSELAASVNRRFASLPLGKWEQSLGGLSKAKDAANVDALDESLGSALLQTMLIRFAAASDEMTDRVAYRNGIVPLRSVPRVLIASAEKTGDSLRLSMDLRLDDVDAIPFPGAPSNVARLFRIGRGIAESVAEGKAIPAGAGDKPATTALLMGRAREQEIPLRVVDKSNVADFARRVGMPDHVLRQLKASVLEGWEAIVPEKPVRIAGSDRWGWWRIEKQSGKTIAMMDNGLHAGMAEYTLSSEHIGLNPNMGFVVGMVVGSVSTLFTISALMLEYGESSPAMMKEVENYLKKVLCTSCPKAEAKAGASITAQDNCLKIEKKIEIGAKAEFNFCDKYVKGFKCAAGLLLHGVTGPIEKYKIEASYEMGCSEGKVEAKAIRKL